jgi:hypothetical protein
MGSLIPSSSSSLVLMRTLYKGLSGDRDGIFKL